tara:strand:- start:220 stop:1104 length:885 start_codon:yes stop_codon:yes gene_type:complete
MTKKNYLAIFAKSFNWAGFFLPKKTYKDCMKLYAFCRVLDDIADEENNLDIKIQKFNKIKNYFKKYYDSKNKEYLSSSEINSIIHDIVELAENNKIKRVILEDLIDGVASDLKKEVHIRTIKDLLIYSYRVAGTVGLMMSRILNVNDNRALRGAIDLGIAMQLTNIARDVIEDKKMNRKYIQPDFENICATLRLAEMFYESSFSSIQKIPFKYKFSIIVARRIYRQIGRKILQKGNMENYEKSGKIYVNNFEKIFQTIISLFDLIIIYLKKIEPHQRVQEHAIISQELDLNARI